MKTTKRGKLLMLACALFYVAGGGWAAFLVLAATDDPDLNRSIVRQAKERYVGTNKHFESCRRILALFF